MKVSVTATETISQFAEKLDLAMIYFCYIKIRKSFIDKIKESCKEIMI